MAQPQLSVSPRPPSDFLRFTTTGAQSEQDLVIDEGIGNSPEAFDGPCSPNIQHFEQDNISALLKSHEILLPESPEKFLVGEAGAESTDIAEEVEIETSPMSPMEDVVTGGDKVKDTVTEITPLSHEHSPNESSDVPMVNGTTYEDISEDDENSSDDDEQFTTEFVSLLTPDSTLVEEDSGKGTGSSSPSSASLTMDTDVQVKGIPVSTIRWAPKIHSEPLSRMDPEEDMDLGGPLDDDEDDDVVFLGEFPGKPSPCFRPYCCNVLGNPRIPGAADHLNPPACSMGHSQEKKPMLFPEPQASEWVLASVYHVDPLDGILRYKCRSCNGVVEQKSFRSRFQLYTQELSHQCPRCEKRYCTKRQLQLHQFRHRERQLPCPYCARRFLTKSELQSHVNTHTQRKMFGCPVCSAAFAHSSRYYAHLRTYHRKYECGECFRKTCARSNSDSS